MVDKFDLISNTLAEDTGTYEGDHLEISAEINVVVFNDGSKEFSDALSLNKISNHPALMNLEVGGMYALCFASDEKLIPSIILNTSAMNMGGARSPVLSKRIKHLASTPWCLPGNRTAIEAPSSANNNREIKYEVNKLKHSQCCVASVDDVISIARSSNRNVEVLTLPHSYDDMRRTNINGCVSMMLAFAAAVVNVVARMPKMLPDGGVLVVRGVIPETDSTSNVEQTEYPADNLSRTVDTLPTAPFEARYYFRDEDIFNYDLNSVSPVQSAHRVYIDINNGRIPVEILNALDRVYLNRCMLSSILFAINDVNVLRGGLWSTNQNEQATAPMTCVDSNLLDWLLHILLGDSYDSAVDELLHVMSDAENRGTAESGGELAGCLDYPAALDRDMFAPDGLLGLAASRTIETPRTQSISRAVEKLVGVLRDVCSIRNAAYTNYRYFPKRLGGLRAADVRSMLLVNGGWRSIYSRGINALRALGNKVREMDRLSNAGMLISEYATSGLDVADIIGGIGTADGCVPPRRRIRP